MRAKRAIFGMDQDREAEASTGYGVPGIPSGKPRQEPGTVSPELGMVAQEPRHSPQPGDAVGIESHVSTDHREPVPKSVGHNHPVERVTVFRVGERKPLVLCTVLSWAALGCAFITAIRRFGRRDRRGLDRRILGTVSELVGWDARSPSFGS